MIWEPWNDVRTKQLPIVLDVEGPPCGECKHWKPVVVSTASGEFDGVRLCHAEEQQFDFSCYRARDGSGHDGR